MSSLIGVVGAGRMGRGIALSYSFAGVPVVLVDLKQRSDQQRQETINQIREELANDLNFLATVGLVEKSKIDEIVSLTSFSHRESGENPLEHCDIVYEGVPEVMEAKTDAFSYVSKMASKTAIVASTTSTFLVTDLAKLISEPKRFLNAHWLNPAHLMPLVEMSKGDQTSQEAIDILQASLESIGKVTVLCSASPGYIVPRIQAIAMNEAARLVEEGVASAEDIDKAVNVGFGLRFAVLGILEFIDWGGGDILHYASKSLCETVGERYTAPEIIGKNMRENKNGIRDGEGFFSYENIDPTAYRQKRMTDFVKLLKHRELLPKYNQSITDQ